MRIPVLAALATQLLSPAPKPGHATMLPSPTEVNGAAGRRSRCSSTSHRSPASTSTRPASKDYIPITVKLNAPPEIKVGKLAYPKSETMTFADEKVPVFQKPFRLTQDVTLDKSAKPGSTRHCAGHGKLSGVRRSRLLSAGIGAGDVDGRW